MFSGLDGNHWNILGGGGIYSTAEDITLAYCFNGRERTFSGITGSNYNHVPEEDGYYYGYWSILLHN